MEVTFNLLKEVFSVKGLPQKKATEIYDLCSKSNGSLSNIIETKKDWSFDATLTLPARKLADFQLKLRELLS
jgi:hypothetical protein